MTSECANEGLNEGLNEGSANLLHLAALTAVDRARMRLRPLRPSIKGLPFQLVTLPSDKPGALPPENGFPLNNVRALVQADSYTQHKHDAVPLWV